MMDEILDSNEEPILYSQIEEKYSDLLEKKRLFYESVTEINQIIETMNLEESTYISLLKNKFNEIENQKNKISEYINNLNNIIPDEDIPMSIKLRNIADIVSNDFRHLIMKFQNIIINIKKNKEEQLQLSLNSDISTNDKSSDPNLNNEIISNKEKIKVEEKEYKQLNDINNLINKENNQDEEVEIIDSNTDETLENNFIRNESLKEYIEESPNYNKNKWLIIIIFIIIFAFLIFYKLYNPNSIQIENINSKKNQNNSKI